MTVRSSWPGPSGQTGTTEARKALSGLFASDSTGAVRAGVLSPVNTQLLAARTDLNVDIAAFQAVAVQFGGAILFANDGVVQLPSPLVSPPAGINYYVVYAKQNESVSPGTDANNTPVVGAALSTSDFATARTSMPTGAVEIGTVQIPSGVTVTTTAKYTAAAGGLVPFRNAGERDAWSPRPGQVGYLIDSAQLTTFDGAVWSGLDRARAWTAKKAAVQALTASTMTNVLSLDLPSWAPPGVYTVTTIGTTFVGTDVDRFTRVRVGSLELDGTSDAYNGHTGQAQYVKVHQFTHTGGAVTVYLDAQVNGGSPQAQPSCRIQVTYQGRA
jgi:hypothetical protein